MALTRAQIARRYREKHRERVLTANRRYAKEHRDAIRAKAKTYKAEHPEAVREWGRKWYAADPDRAKAKARRANMARFGITVEEYETLLISQGGVCAICRQADQSGKRLAVDHCHNSDKVRGLLCSNCNPGIGYFRDSPELLRLAIDYLTRQAAP